VILLLSLAIFGSQAAFMLVDEFYFHRRRRLPRWERVGHPLDTLTVLLCYAVALLCPPSFAAGGAYVAVGVFSCLFVTKDEWLHARLCSPAEHWLHSVLFVLHPVVLGLVGFLWVQGGQRTLLTLQAAVTLAFGVYQTVYWNFSWKQPSFER
jgi:hypothetical protein